MTVSAVKFTGDLNDINQIQQCFRKIFEEIGYKPSVGNKVFIKPNLCGRDPKNKAENTSVELLEALVNFLLENKCEVFIGHTSLLGLSDKKYPFKEITTTMGYNKLTSRQGVHLVNLDDNPTKKVQIKKFTFEVPQILSEMDHVITLTKFKTHTQTTFSLSLKNQMGLVALPSKRMMHLNGIHEAIAELNTIVVPKIGIIDGILAMEGQGPHNGHEFRADLLLGGTDLVELDSLACYLAGQDYHSVGYIVESEKRGVGHFLSPAIMEKYKSFIIPFKPAQNCTEKIKNIFVWPTNSCASCAAAVVELGMRLDTLKREDFERDFPRVDFFMGTGEGLDLSKMGKVVGIGDCTKHFCETHGLDFLPGCPMAIYKVGEFVIDVMESVAIKEVQLGFRYLRLGLLNRVMDTASFKKEYDQICNTYEDLWGEYTKPYNEALIKSLHFGPNMKVLDLACGTGQNLLNIAMNDGSGEYIGVDISKGMLELARQKFKDNNLPKVTFIEEDMLKAFDRKELSESHSFDRIICLWAIGYSKPVDILKNAMKLLKPGGKLGIIANMDEHPSIAYKVFMELAADFPKALQVMVKHNFPKTLDAFQQFFKEAGIPTEKVTFEENQFDIVVPDGKAALDWLLKTGSGALYDDAIKPDWKDKIREKFMQRIERYKNDEGIKLIHKFVIANFQNSSS